MPRFSLAALISNITQSKSHRRKSTGRAVVRNTEQDQCSDQHQKKKVLLDLIWIDNCTFFICSHRGKAFMLPIQRIFTHHHHHLSLSLSLSVYVHFWRHIFKSSQNHTKCIKSKIYLECFTSWPLHIGSKVDRLLLCQQQKQQQEVSGMNFMVPTKCKMSDNKLFDVWIMANIHSALQHDFVEAFHERASLLLQLKDQSHKHQCLIF